MPSQMTRNLEQNSELIYFYTDTPWHDIFKQGNRPTE